MAPVDALGVGDVHEHTPARGERRPHRRGQPSGAQRATVEAMGARATWNRFGTPSSLMRDGGWLAEGLDGSPAAAAREFVRRNAALFRLSQADVAGLELVSDARLAGSEAHAVIFRRRFGGLRAPTSGLLVVGIGTARSPTPRPASAGEAPSRERAGCPPRRPGRRPPAASASACRRRRLGPRRPQRLRPLPGRAGSVRSSRCARWPSRPRATACAARSRPTSSTSSAGPAYTVLVDAESGAVLRRVNRLDEAADQPNWKYFTNNPPLSGGDTDRRIVGCFPAGAPAGRALSTSAGAHRGATPFPWDVIDGAPPTQTTTGNNADTGLSGVSPLTPGLDRVRPVSATREYVYPFADQWRNSKCNPEEFAGFPTPSDGRGPRLRRERPQRRDRLAVREPQQHARLVVQPRLHRDDLQHAGQQLRQDAAPAGRRPRAGQRPGRSRRRRLPDLHGPRQREPDHARRRHRADHEHVPLAADGERVLPALRGRRLRHVGDRPRVHARDLQPHGGRPRQRPDQRRRRPGARDGRVVLGPDRRRVPDGARLRALRRREPVRGRGLRHRLQAEGHPQLRHERQPAQLLRRPGLRRLGHGLARTTTARSGAPPTTTSGRRWSPSTERARAASQLACARGQTPADQCPGNRRWMQTRLRRLPADADGRRGQHARGARRLPVGRHDANRRRQPPRAVDGVRPARHG